MSKGNLTIRELQALNTERAKQWHPGGVEDWSLSDWAVAMAGECGEACNVVKKLNRERDLIVGNGPHEKLDAVLREDLGKEIADTVLYALLLAERAGVDLEQALIDKFNEVSERNGFPHRIYPVAA